MKTKRKSSKPKQSTYDPSRDAPYVASIVGEDTKSSGGNEKALATGDRIWHLGRSEAEILEISTTKGYRLKFVKYKSKGSGFWEKDLQFYTSNCTCLPTYPCSAASADLNSEPVSPGETSPPLVTNCPACSGFLARLDDGCGICGWSPVQNLKSKIQNPPEPERDSSVLGETEKSAIPPEPKPIPPEPKRRTASGWLERYVKNKKLKSGILATFPRCEGERDPDNPEHWYWAYKHEHKSDKARSANGFISRAVSVPATKVAAVQNAIARRWPVQKILSYIRGEL